MHITTNNTIAGALYHTFPETPAGGPLIADMSSDFMSRVININDFAGNEGIVPLKTWLKSGCTIINVPRKATLMIKTNPIRNFSII